MSRTEFNLQTQLLSFTLGLFRQKQHNTIRATGGIKSFPFKQMSWVTLNRQLNQKV